MIKSAYDSTSATLFLRAWGAALETDIRLFRNALLELDRDAAEGERVPVTILEVAEGAAKPSAAQRQMLADMWNEVTAPRHLFALITTSPVARGIFRVVHWLNPPGLRREESVHSTFAQALQWAQERRGETLPRLSALREQATDGAR